MHRLAIQCVVLLLFICTVRCVWAGPHDYEPVVSTLNADVKVTPSSPTRAEALLTVEPDPPRRLCAIAYTDGQTSARAVRTRIVLPTDRPWTLFTFAACTTRPLMHRRNQASAMIFDGRERQRVLSAFANEDYQLDGSSPFVDFACGTRDTAALKQLLERLDELPKYRKLFPAVPANATGGQRQFWTAKTTADAVTQLLIYDAQNDPCEAVKPPTRDALIADAPLVEAVSAKLTPPPNTQLAVDLLDAPSDLDGVGPRIARIEFVGRDPKTLREKLEYCSGLVLNTRTVISAGHCARPLAVGCASPHDLCDSYNVDIYYRRPIGDDSPPYDSIPIKQGITLYQPPAHQPPPIEQLQPPSADATTAPEYRAPDFAWFTLDSLPHLDIPSLPKLPDVRLFDTFSEKMKSEAGSDAFMLAHPAGHFMQLSRPCNVMGMLGNSLLHTCVTAGGSSGAPVWAMPLPGMMVPVGIHVRAGRYCLGSRDWDSIPSSIQDSFEQPSRKRFCVGVATSFAEAYCAFCKSGSKVSGCAQLSELVPPQGYECK